MDNLSSEQNAQIKRTAKMLGLPERLVAEQLADRDSFKDVDNEESGSD